MEDVGDAGAIGDVAEHGRADARDPEGKPEKHSGDEADFSWHELLRVNQDGGKRGRENDADDDREHAGPEKIRVGERDGERRDAEDRDPDDQFASVAVTDRSAEDRPDRNREEEEKEKELRALDREMEFSDHVKGLVTR